jgi:valyl-tRNA synthetase
MRAEREVEVLKSIIGAARDLRAQMKLDPRKVVEGTLYSKSAAVEIARGSAGAIQKLAAINLEVVEGSAPVNSGVHAATPEFDLVLRVPAAEAEARREKIGKVKAQLEKARDSSHRQLQNEEFLASGRDRVDPAKLAYEARSPS